MTVRLTIQYSSNNHEVVEYENLDQLMRYLVGPLQYPGHPNLIVIQELDAPEETTWGHVSEGDEIIAPDGSCWMLEKSSGDGRVYLAAIDDGRPLTFPVTPNMPIRRRPGVLTAATQLLRDVGLYGGPM